MELEVVNYFRKKSSERLIEVPRVVSYLGFLILVVIPQYYIVYLHLYALSKVVLLKTNSSKLRIANLYLKVFEVWGLNFIF